MKDKTSTQHPALILNPMMPRDIGASHGAYIKVAVHGFWSDVITISARRDLKFDEWLAECKKQPEAQRPDRDAFAHWDVSVSHSSGGRDRDEVPDDLAAELFFAEGLRMAVEHAQWLRANWHVMEEAYQDKRAAEDAKRAAEAEAQRAAEAADPAVGRAAAIRTIHTITETVRKLRREDCVLLKVLKRGTDFTYLLRAHTAHDGSVRFRHNDKPIGREAATQLLAEGSIRSHFEVESPAYSLA